MADIIKISDENLTLSLEEGIVRHYPASILDQMYRQKLSMPFGNHAIPDGVKFLKRQDNCIFIVHEMPPMVRRLEWIDKNKWLDKNNGRKILDAPRYQYKSVKISLPYVITIASVFQFTENRFQLGPTELYFRNSPLTSLQDTLGIPALPNVAKNLTGGVAHNFPRRFSTTVCTGLGDRYYNDLITPFSQLIEHFWNSGFNESMGSDSYTHSKTIHPMLHPIENWEKNTIENERFILDVPWVPNQVNLRETLDYFLRYYYEKYNKPQPLTPPLAQQLGNFALSAK